ncbi:MAG: PGF-CTERM sorting domain-containing protein [Candidatus Methanospirareceae archaeon]
MQTTFTPGFEMVFAIVGLWWYI